MLRQVQGKGESEYIALKSYQTDKRLKTLLHQQMHISTIYVFFL